MHDPQLRSWVYTPTQSVEEARRWAIETMVISEESTDLAAFLDSKVLMPLPYLLADGRPQFLRAYLIRLAGAENAFGFFFHGTHAFIDAKPALNACYLFLEYLTSEHSTGITDLKWGSENSRLPPGPVTATGGPKSEWATAGAELMAKLMESQKDVVCTSMPELCAVS